MIFFKNTNYTVVVLLISLFICDFYFTPIPAGIFLFLIACWFLITTLGSFNIKWNYHLKAFNGHKNNAKKQIALTFDDGPNEKFTQQVLDLLKKHQATATFFCIGKNIEKHPELVKSILKDGHVIGNHTYSHSNFFGFYNAKKVIIELEKTNALVKSQTHKELNYFRPPFGVTNPAISKAIKHTKHTVFGWNIRSYDTVLKDDKKITSRILKRISPGAIILLHDTHDRIIPVLEQLLIFLQENNYQTVSLETLSDIKAYA
ncbi:polysaccharide deacetylase family protein [Polaribacter sp.]|uniref:polysaccharide deacetylase family protein n=1 Tax=Polaribacter sp. TaxID=1920175 RepID=UPI003EF207E4